MRKLILFSLIFITLSSFINISTIVPTGEKITTSSRSVSKKDLTLEKLTKMKVKEFEKLTGKKLTLKEKIAFKIVQGKIKKQLKAKEGETSEKGKTAMILGIIGLVLAFIPYGIIASIPLAIIAIVTGSQARKANPKDTKALTGMILGWVTLGLIILFLILALIWLASWSWI